ncbi:MAG: serine hydrolase domain-containing protein [Chitinophagales bacterium]
MKHLALIPLALLASVLAGAQNTPAFLARIDSVINASMAANKMPAISLGIVKDGHIFYLKGYGTKAVGEDSPVDSATNFLTCSVSKLFTATAVMQLVEQGKIDIHKRLTDYLPDFYMKDERYKEITIEQMLTHTSGLPNIYNRHFIKPGADSLELTLFARKLKSKRLSYPPGVQLSAHTYSNTAYNILGLVIERVTGQSYSDYVEQHVLKPVGMNYSSFRYRQIPESRRSRPHIKGALGKPVVSNYYPDIPQDKPCGNLNSCSYDLSLWMLHNLGIYNNTDTGGVIKNTTLTTMWTTQKPIPTFSTSMGLGWWVVDSKKYGKYVFHDGNDPGYSAALVVSPGNNFGIVVLCNAMYPQEIVWNELPFRVIDLFEKEWKK